jgi:hypothetical protein
MQIHVVLDNLDTHKPKNDRWLKRHPNLHFHVTSTRGFGIIETKAAAYLGSARVQKMRGGLGQTAPRQTCFCYLSLALMAINASCASFKASSTVFSPATAADRKTPTLSRISNHLGSGGAGFENVSDRNNGVK